jgi:putative hemolysin
MIVPELFKRTCRTCGRIFYCDNDCGKLEKSKHSNGCECGLCHAKTVRENGRSCEERMERNKYRYQEVVQFT